MNSGESSLFGMSFLKLRQLVQRRWGTARPSHYLSGLLGSCGLSLLRQLLSSCSCLGTCTDKWVGEKMFPPFPGQPRGLNCLVPIIIMLCWGFLLPIFLISFTYYWVWYIFLTYRCLWPQKVLFPGVCWSENNLHDFSKPAFILYHIKLHNHKVT